MFANLTTYEVLVIAFYFFVLFVLALYGFHRSHLLFLLLTRKPIQLRCQTQTEDLPFVTVQLPIFNEANVVQRLIQAAGNLNYPKDRFEIQVLDDSTDETKDLAAKEAKRLQALGVQICHLHRTNRHGFKAGALEAGMKTAKGEFLLILDADFLPQPSLISDLLGHFQDPRTAMVQARWEFLNSNDSSVTKSQAMLLNGHFKIEHEARFRANLFFNFNGTAGMWRKHAIEDAGGWQHDTITEDTDLSYRAQMRGWTMCYVDSVGVASELPSNMNAFKAQQKRWAKGLLQTARKILPALFRSDVPFRIKAEAFFHLTNHITAVFLILLVLLQMPNLYLRAKPHTSVLLFLDIPLLVGTFFSVISFYLTAHQKAGGNIWYGCFQIPHMMALGVGLSINNAFAALSGLWSREAIFERTPKQGNFSTKKYRSALSLVVFAELCFVAYLINVFFLAIRLQMWVYLPFLTLFLWGYLEVALRSLLRK